MVHQGAAKIGTSPDYVVIMGATQLELSLIVAPEIKTVADLAGKTLRWMHSQLALHLFFLICLKQQFGSE